MTTVLLETVFNAVAESLLVLVNHWLSGNDLDYEMESFLGLLVHILYCDSCPLHLFTCYPNLSPHYCHVSDTSTYCWALFSDDAISGCKMGCLFLVCVQKYKLYKTII